MLEIFVLYATCIGLIGVAVRYANADGVVSFPFLYSVVWVAFVIPQMISVYFSDSYEAQFYITAGTADAVLVFVLSSILLGFWGYAIGLKRAARIRRDGHGKSLRGSPVGLSSQRERRLNFSGLLLFGISTAAFLQLARLGGGLSSYLLEGGSYAIVYEGLPVYLVFVSRFVYVAIALALYLWARTGKRWYFVLAIIYTTVPFFNIFFVFRRSEVLIVGTIYLYFSTKYGKFRPNRGHILLMIGLMMAVVQVFPVLRSLSRSDDDFSIQLVTDTALTKQGFATNTEIGAALYRFQDVMTGAKLQYGTIFWDALVNQFIPAGLVGREFKAALLLGSEASQGQGVLEFIGYLSPMGFAQAFQQFWYLGCFVFFVIGFLFAFLETRRYVSARREIFFALLIAPFVTAVSNDLSVLVTRAATYWVIVMLVIPSDFSAKRYYSKPVSLLKKSFPLSDGS